MNRFWTCLLLALGLLGVASWPGEAALEVTGVEFKPLADAGLGTPPGLGQGNEYTPLISVPTKGESPS